MYICCATSSGAARSAAGAATPFDALHRRIVRRVPRCTVHLHGSPKGFAMGPRTRGIGGLNESRVLRALCARMGAPALEERMREERWIHREVLATRGADQHAAASHGKPGADARRGEPQSLIDLAQASPVNTWMDAHAHHSVA